MSWKQLVEQAAALRSSGHHAEAFSLLRGLPKDGFGPAAADPIRVADEFRALGALEDAQDMYRLALSLQPESLSAGLWLARLERQRGDHHAAAGLLTRLLERSPGDVEVRLETARVLAADRNASGALAHVDAVLAARPAHAAARAQRAAILMQLGEAPAALEIYESVLRAHPGDVGAALDVARTLNVLGRTEEARRAARDVLSSNPGHVGALTVAADLAQQAGDVGTALTLWAEAAGRFPESAEYKLRHAQLLVRLGASERGLEELADLAREFPRAVDVKVAAGLTARIVGLPERGLAWLREAAALRPFRSRLYLECARDLQHLGRQIEALESLDRMHSAAADDADVVELRLAIQAVLWPAEAKRAVTSALEQEARPERVLHLIRPAWAWGLFEATLRKLEPLLHADPPALAAKARAAMARTYVLAGIWKDAAQALESIAPMLLSSAQVLDVAETASELGDPPALRQCLEQFAEIVRTGGQRVTRDDFERSLRLSTRMGQFKVRTALLEACGGPLPADVERPRVFHVATLRVEEGLAEPAHFADLEMAAIPKLPWDAWSDRLLYVSRDYRAYVERVSSRPPGARYISVEDIRRRIRSLIELEEIGAAWEVLNRRSAAYASREFVLERAELLHRDLRLQEEIECLRAAARQDPANHRIHAHLVRALTDLGELDEAGRLLDAWSARQPVSMEQLRTRLQWGLAKFADWPPMRALRERVLASASRRMLIDLKGLEIDQLMLQGLHDHADSELGDFLDQLPRLPISRSHATWLRLGCAGRLLILGRHADAQQHLDELVRSRVPRVTDHIHRLAGANEAFRGNLERSVFHRNRSLNTRHHLRIHEFSSDVPTAAPPVRTAVLLHLFHTDLWPDLRRHLHALRGTAFELFVTSRKDGLPAEIVRDLKDFAPNVSIRTVENRGFDIGAHWQHLDDIDLRRFDVALLLHTKKSRHTRVGDAWRNNLLGALLGSPERWRDNLWQFVRNPRVGMIASAHHRNTHDLIVCKEMRAVLVALGMPTEFDSLKPHLEFVGGTMFMMRADLLREMYEKTRDAIQFEPYPSLSLAKRLDRTFGHALERAFGFYVRWRGFNALWRP